MRLKPAKIVRQRGLGIATAIFVLTVLALLAVFINRLVEFNARSASEAIELVNAFYAAESGAQLTMTGLFPPDGSSGATTYCDANISAAFSFSVSGLSNCSANVACSYLDVDVDSDGTDEQFYTITSLGSCGDVTRTIQVRAQ